MKRVVLVLAIVLMVPAMVFGASLQWNPPTTNTDGSVITDLAGYNAYDITAARIKLNTAVIPKTICVSNVCTWGLVTLPVDGQKYAVRAIDTSNNESIDSNVATYSTIPSVPGALLIILP